MADPAAETTGSSVLGGGLWSVASRLLPQLYLFAVSIAAARFLGPDAMGRQSFIAFVSLSATLLVSGGMALSLARYVGETLGRRQPERLRALVRWAWWVEGAAAALCGIAIAAVAAGGAEPQGAWLLAAAVAALATLHTVPHAVLVGTQRWRDASRITLTTGTLSLPALIIVLAAGGGITGMFAVEAVAAAVTLAWAGVVASRLLTRLSPATRPARELGRAAGRYALGSTVGVVITLIVFRRSEFFFLNHYSSDAEIAIYSIAFAVVSGLIVLPEALATAILPAFATLFGAGASERIRAGFGRALRLMVVSAFPVTALVLALGPEALRLVYGDEYAGTGEVLRIMVLALPLVPLMSVSEALLAGLGKLKAPLVVGGFAAVANLLLAFALVPSHGAVGAGIANTAAQLAASVGLIAYSWRLVGGIRWELSPLLRNLLASLVAGGAAWLAVDALGGIAGVLAGLACFTALYLLAAWMLRMLAPDDADWLGEIAGSRLGPRAKRVTVALARGQ